jgi:arsenate reductase
MLDHLARGLGKDVRAHSAGSAPSGRINPFAIEALRNAGIDTGRYRSKSWDEFTLPDAPLLDFIITVCDNAAGEACPVWPGQPVTAHWGVPDPAAVEGSEVEKHLAFADTARVFRRRIELFLSLSLRSLDSMSLQNQVRDIGKQ